MRQVLINSLSGDIKSALFQFMQTIYDTIVFALVIFKAVSVAMSTGFGSGVGVNGSVTKLLATQGILYYG